ncbi:MAG: PorT family protein [Sphingobacteriales bacterium]|nr:PorT family protein [Sphingobacteriales bacterium]
MIKKIMLVTFIVLATAGGVYAQKGMFGLRAGINFQNINGKDNAGNSLNNKMLTGFNAGIMIDNPVSGQFTIQPGLLFSTKGAKSEDGSVKIHFSYLEIPLNFIYEPAINKNKLMLGGGPYVAFAVAGNEESTSGTRKIQFKSKVLLSDMPNTTKAYYRGFDAGLNFLAGYRLNNNFSIQLNAQFGLTNIFPGYEVPDYNAKLKNTGFGVSIGYRFPLSSE